MNLNTPSGRAELRARRACIMRDQPARTSEEAYAQMDRVNALIDASLRLDEPVFSARRTCEDDIRAQALEHEERRALGPVDGTEDDISPGG